MNTSAFLMMVGTMTLVSAFTLYFFFKVMRAPMHKREHRHLPDPADFGRHEM
ncbi:MAG: hypothetical protein N2110_03865 [Flavobacteriales bacterium]|nr:hypothetical protein [Flavobacteriales bacterium]MCX7768146.1 hypothetical protein [Flavobacteriales bacterium]MDW8409562.1 hypothetical protein [Flavobacteriales bacterium]